MIFFLLKMVNATQMAKPFGHGKEPSYWLSTQQAKNMIKAIAASRNLEPTDLVIVKNGGSDYGTWFHEDVTLVFAQWLLVKKGGQSNLGSSAFRL